MKGHWREREHCFHSGIKKKKAVHNIHFLPLWLKELLVLILQELLWPRVKTLLCLKHQTNGISEATVARVSVSAQTCYNYNPHISGQCHPKILGQCNQTCSGLYEREAWTQDIPEECMLFPPKTQILRGSTLTLCPMNSLLNLRS